MPAETVVILTALNLEYTAVRERLTDLREEQERGTRFEVGTVPGARCRIALALTGKGNHAAGVWPNGPSGVTRPPPCSS